MGHDDTDKYSKDAEVGLENVFTQWDLLYSQQIVSNLSEMANSKRKQIKNINIEGLI